MTKQCHSTRMCIISHVGKKMIRYFYTCERWKKNPKRKHNDNPRLIILNPELLLCINNVAIVHAEFAWHEYRSRKGRNGTLQGSGSLIKNGAQQITRGMIKVTKTFWFWPEQAKFQNGCLGVRNILWKSGHLGQFKMSWVPCLWHGGELHE